MSDHAPRLVPFKTDGRTPEDVLAEVLKAKPRQLVVIYAAGEEDELTYESTRMPAFLVIGWLETIKATIVDECREPK